MGATLKRMTAYLESLPRGVQSYPDYLMKAALYRAFLAEIPDGRMSELRGMPDPLYGLIERPPPVTAWVPEVQGTAICLAIADAFFVSDEVFLVRKLEANRRILKGPLYRVLFLFVSPEVALRNISTRWQQFHRGIVTKVLETTPRSATIRLEYPHSLVPKLQARAYAMAFQAAVEATGGRDASVAVASLSSTFATFEGVWR